MTTSISAITVCKNRLNDLKRTLPRLVSCGFDEIVLVDYDCPQKCGDWVAAHYPEVKVVRHQGDEGFSAARAKNLGARRVTSDWILFIDADIEVDPESAGRMRRVLKNRYYYRAEKGAAEKRPAYGTFIVSKKDFDRVTGFDEVYVGWGCEDDDIFYRLDISGLRLLEFPASLISEILTNDADRMRYSPVKSRAYQYAINEMYFSAKRRILPNFRKIGDLTLEVRRRLYQEIVDQAKGIMELENDPYSTRSVTLSIRLPPMRTFIPLQCSQSITIKYDFTRITPPSTE